MSQNVLEHTREAGTGSPQAAALEQDSLARRYALRHLKTDPGITDVYYLPRDAPDREIRFLEINELIAEREADPLEPIDFGIETGHPASHTLMVLDVTPGQWEKIRNSELSLPSGWSLDDATRFQRKGR